jgi:hypothetical protein
MEFVGGLTCCLVPNSSLWGLYVLVECFLYSDKVLASNIGDVGPEELCRDLNYSTVLSPMFQVKGAINDLVCLDVVMGKGFSTGDGKGFVYGGCRGHIWMIYSGREERWCRLILHRDFCRNVGSMGCRWRDGGTNIGGSSTRIIRLLVISSTLDRCSAELLCIVIVKRSSIRGRKIVSFISIFMSSQDVSQKQGLTAHLHKSSS